MIILDASVKWELTAWPLMDTVNVAVTHLVADPRRGALGPTLKSYRGCHRVTTDINDMVLASVDHKLIFHGRVLFSCVRVRRYKRAFTHHG